MKKTLFLAEIYLLFYSVPSFLYLCLELEFILGVVEFQVEAEFF